MCNIDISVCNMRIKKNTLLYPCIINISHFTCHIYMPLFNCYMQAAIICWHYKQCHAPESIVQVSNFSLKTRVVVATIALAFCCGLIQKFLLRQGCGDAEEYGSERFDVYPPTSGRLLAAGPYSNSSDDTEDTIAQQDRSYDYVLHSQPPDSEPIQRVVAVLVLI